MNSIKQFQIPLVRKWVPGFTVPFLIGCLMLCASFLPWLRDPLGENYSAWMLPVDPGWQWRTSIFNYGILCCGCAFYAFSIALIHRFPFKKYQYSFTQWRVLGGVCMLPAGLFLWQYLCSDIQTMSLLARRELQVLLTQRHFGYGVAAQPFPLDPFTFNIATAGGRLQLFLCLLSFGPLLLCIVSCATIVLSKKLRGPPVVIPPRVRLARLLLAGAIVLALSGRTLSGLFCEYQATNALSVGDYTMALRWLDYARFFRPELEQLAQYHTARGQALYFQAPEQVNNDSLAYLAASYRKQENYLDAYQQLLALWHADRTASWVKDEMNITLVHLIELPRPLRGLPVANKSQMLLKGNMALPWVHKLLAVDPTNIYGLYVAGRIQYNMYDYEGCKEKMQDILHLTSETSIRSSAYTYVALSFAQLGNYLMAREMLFKALACDPGYRNNTAREELSGLH